MKPLRFLLKVTATHRREIDQGGGHSRAKACWRVVTHSPLTATARVQLQAICGMSFTANAWWFPLGVFFHPQKGSKLFHLEPSHKAD